MRKHSRSVPSFRSRQSRSVHGSFIAATDLTSTDALDLSSAQQPRLLECSHGIANHQLLARAADRGIDLELFGVWQLYLSVRASKRLNGAGICTLRQLAECTETDLLSMYGLGVTTLKEIRAKLHAYLENLIDASSQQSEARGLGKDIVTPPILRALEYRGFPLDSTDVQSLGLSLQESKELEMFNIRTVQELVNCARNGFLDLLDLRMSTVEGIKNKLRAYLAALLQLPYGEEASLAVRRSAIIEPLIMAQAEGRGLALDTIRVTQMGLGTRASRALAAAGIDSIQQLADCAPADLLHAYGAGAATLNEIKEKANAHLSQLVDTIPQAEQLIELIGRLCHTLETHVALEEVPLPQFAQHILHEATGQTVTTVADLRQLANMPSPQIAALNTSGTACSEASFLAQSINWLEQVVLHGSIDLEVSALIKHLDDRERFILTSRFGMLNHLTLGVLGERFQITRERIRQVEKKMRKKLVAIAPSKQLLFSAAGVATIGRLDEGATVHSWVQRLIDAGFLKDRGSADLLVAISGVINTPPLALPEEFDRMLRPQLPSHVILASRTMLVRARKLCRNCGAIRMASLATDVLSEDHVEEIVSSDGFTEVGGRWWTKNMHRCVPERIARKMIAWCGPVSPPGFRQAFLKHLGRAKLPAPPSDVLVKVLQRTGNFVLIDGMVALTRPQLRRPGLTAPESVFVRMAQTDGPLMSFETVCGQILQQGLSKASAVSLLRYSPIVKRVKPGLYALHGTQYSAADVDHVESQTVKIRAHTTLRPRPDGVVEFETNVGSWMIYGGVLNSGPARQLEGDWHLVADNMAGTKLVVGRGFIWGLSAAAKSLNLLPMDRIRIEFNTWTRQARIAKMVKHDQAE